MASTADLVKKLFTHIESGNFDAADALLADDFRFSGPLPEPVKKKEFLEVHQALVSAIPDWKFNATEFQEKGDLLEFKVHVNGTHSRKLDLPGLGLNAVSQTGRRIALPEEPSAIRIKNGKLVEFTVSVVPGGGLLGLLKQLGIALPTPARV